MKNFCVLKEIGLDMQTSEEKDAKKIREMRDYVIGKYLRLIYLCLSLSQPDSKDLLRDTQKFAYFYGASKIESNQVENLPIEYLEQQLGPDSSQKPEEERKKTLVAKYRSLMMERHARLLENDAAYLVWKYKIKNWKQPETLSEKDLIEEGKQIKDLIEFSSVVPERQNLTYHVIVKKWYLRWQTYTRCNSSEEESKTATSEAEPHHPGPINTPVDIKSIIDTESVDRLEFDIEIGRHFQLKRTAKEEKDYIVVP